MNKIIDKLLKGILPTQGMLIARTLVGGYLVYLAYSLITTSEESGMNPAVLYSFCVLFFLVGGIVLIKVVHNFVTGYYKGGKLDPEVLEKEAEVETEDETE